MVKNLIIVRGLPGSGKSTAAETHSAIYVERHFLDWTGQFQPSWYASADEYWGTPYNFVPEKLSEAHLYCRLSTLVGMKHQAENVYVDNTNIKKKDYQVYLDLAAEHGYTCQFLESGTPWAWDVDECTKRNIHKVPREVIQRMKDNYEVDERFPTTRLPYEQRRG